MKIIIVKTPWECPYIKYDTGFECNLCTHKKHFNQPCCRNPYDFSGMCPLEDGETRRKIIIVKTPWECPYIKYDTGFLIYICTHPEHTGQSCCQNPYNFSGVCSLEDVE